ncbi:hypothetical protein DRF62_02135 [Chryseobacterium piscium]|uniref:Uncharacterized protein n=1 Tax=Chryseobacterium piscium TaxID=333702 RepID=A0A3D9BTY0_9FLAO|nr:hypothetical protein [Chryseobacterium piscium]REC56979.1 hypothetical protein DRF62_02135 [Chryseobacterium piscium]
MKQIELELQKRLLVVEYVDKKEAELDLLTHKAFPESYKTVICLGSELTEEIAKGLVHQSIHTGLFAHYVKDIPVNTYCYKSALESFSTGIKNEGYNIGGNPVSLEREKHYRDFGNTFVADGILRSWQEADRRTFNPEKTLIFEILL